MIRNRLIASAMAVGTVAGVAACSGKSAPSLESFLSGSWHCVDQNPASDSSSTPLDAQLSLGLGSWSLKEAGSTETIRGSWAIAGGRLRVLVTEDDTDSVDPVAVVGTEYDIAGLPATATEPSTASGNVVSSVVGSTDTPTTTSLRVDYADGHIVITLAGENDVNETISCSAS